MAQTLQELETRRDTFSEFINGRAFPINGDSNVNVTAIHNSRDTTGVSTVLDSLWLCLHNTSAAAVDVTVVVGPADDTSAADVDTASFTVTIPANDFRWVLQGQSTRQSSATNTWTLGAYVAPGDVGSVKGSGYIIRQQSQTLY